ncbi:GlyGly-CTERM sorting domain-containing protein [Pseudomonas fluorescens]
MSFLSLILLPLFARFRQQSRLCKLHKRLLTH